MTHHTHGDGNGDIHRANPDPIEQRDRELGRAEFRDPEKREDPSRSGEYDIGRRIPGYETRSSDYDTRDPDEIEREIERTRADMDETLDALERKLSPGQIMDQAIDYLRSGPGGFASNFGTTIRDNPLPVALTAIGIGWLMFAGGREERRVRTRYVTRYHYDDEYVGSTGDTSMSAEDRYGTGYGATSPAGTYAASGSASYTTHGSSGGSEAEHESRLSRARRGVSDATHRASEMAHDARERASEFAHDVQDRVSGYYSSARDRTTGAYSGARSRAGEFGRSARYSAGRTREGFSYMLEEHPLTLGAVGIAVGALLGACLPSTRRESELFGETRDEVIDRAKEMGREEAERMRRVAEAAAGAAQDAAKEEADRQGLTGSGTGSETSASSGTTQSAKADDKKKGTSSTTTTTISSTTSTNKNVGGSGI